MRHTNFIFVNVILVGRLSSPMEQIKVKKIKVDWEIFGVITPVRKT